MLAALFLIAAVQTATATSTQDVRGEARLKCQVKHDGALDDCEVISETPEERGFGSAALRLSRGLREPSRAGQTINLPVRFQMTVAEADVLGITPEGSPPLVSGGDWLRRPTGDDVARFYPEGAMRAGLAGRVLIRCTVDETGRMTACRPLHETPEGMGFGARAAAMSEKGFRIGPRDSKGRDTAGRPINLPITFMLR